jgi:hypothetical protein
MIVFTKKIEPKTVTQPHFLGNFNDATLLQAQHQEAQLAVLRSRRQRSLQYFTSAHTFSHFLRQVNGRPQCAQIFCGKSRFLAAFFNV